MTKNQHYIPQVYLRGFSPKYTKPGETSNHEKYMVYSYDLDKRRQSPEVLVESVCSEKYLYEFKGENGEFIYPNLLENRFKKIEDKFYEHRKKLECMINIEHSYRISDIESFL